MSTASMQIARAQHTATLLPNGLVAVAGGFHGPTPTTELYDSSTASWSLGGDLIVPRSSHRTVLLPSGDILVVAGFNGDPPSHPSLPDFDHQALTDAEIGTLVENPTPTPTPYANPDTDTDTDTDSDSDSDGDANTDTCPASHNETTEGPER